MFGYGCFLALSQVVRTSCRRQRDRLKESTDTNSFFQHSAHTLTTSHHQALHVNKYILLPHIFPPIPLLYMVGFLLPNFSLCKHCILTLPHHALLYSSIDFIHFCSAPGSASLSTLQLFSFSFLSQIHEAIKPMICSLLEELLFLFIHFLCACCSAWASQSC